MKANFEAALARVLQHEGGYVNDSRDPGGMTNLGCTRRVLEAFRGCSVTEADMRALTPADVAPLYKTKYWDAVNGDALPSGVDYCVFDAAINSGAKRAAQWLQQVVGVSADGAIGPGTLKALAAISTAEVVTAYSERRLAFLKALYTWPDFGRGWGRRVAEVQTAASSMTETTA